MLFVSCTRNKIRQFQKKHRLENAAGMHCQFTAKCNPELPKKNSLWLISGKFIENFIYSQMQDGMDRKINYNFFKLSIIVTKKLISTHEFSFLRASC